MRNLFKLTHEQLRAVQLKQLEILKEIKKICETNNIKYYLLGGTLLGAVRHKGFIPWDDDLDIGMLREDYEKFLSIARNQLPDKYFLQTTYLEQGYSLPFAKIRANGTILEESNISHLNIHKGIWIDVFPLDGVLNPQGKLIKWRYKLINLCTTMIGYTNKAVELKKLKTIVFVKIFSLIGIKKLDKIRTFLMKLDENKDYRYITNFGSNYGFNKQLVQKSTYGNPVYIEFEDSEFFAPSEYEYLLKKIFGDYMKLPPLEKRISGHIITNYKI